MIARNFIFIISLSLLGFLSQCTCDRIKDEASSNRSSSVIFEYKGKKYTAQDLPDQYRVKLFEAEQRNNRMIRKLIDDYVVEQYIAAEAKRLNKTPAELRQERTNVKEPTDAEMRAFYDLRKAQIPYPYEAVKEQIKKSMMRHDDEEKTRSLLNSAREFGKFELLLPIHVESPEIEIDIEGRPMKGNSAAKVTVVEYADFTCGHCGQAFRNLLTVFPRYKDSVRFVFKHFPLNENGPAMVIAHGSECAYRQGKFWEYHDEAFANQHDLNSKSPETIGMGLQLDMEQYRTCLNDQSIREEILKSKKQAISIGVQATPTFFVNGRMVNADPKLEKLQQELNMRLK